MSELDRGAMLALDLFRRGFQTQEGEEGPDETAETIRDAIKADGLAAVIRRQMDYETDFLVDPDDGEPMYDDFPAELAALAADVPKTIWK